MDPLCIIFGKFLLNIFSLLYILKINSFVYLFILQPVSMSRKSLIQIILWNFNTSYAFVECNKTVLRSGLQADSFNVDIDHQNMLQGLSFITFLMDLCEITNLCLLCSFILQIRRLLYMFKILQIKISNFTPT